MPIKYILKDKNNNWKVSLSKTGKTVRSFKTQKEAIAFVSQQKNTEGIMVKRKNGWENTFFVNKSQKDTPKQTKTANVKKQDTPKQTKTTSEKKQDTPKQTKIASVKKQEAPKQVKTKEIKLSFDNTYEQKIAAREDKKRSWKQVLIALVIILVIVGLCFVLGYFLRSEIF